MSPPESRRRTEEELSSEVHTTQRIPSGDLLEQRGRRWPIALRLPLIIGLAALLWAAIFVLV